MNLTYNEILDTFNALKKTAVYIENIWKNIEAFFMDCKRFVFIGCGSSYSLAKSMSVMTFMNTGFQSSAMAAGDILLNAGRYEKCFRNAVIVCVSRSGRTSEMLMALEELKSRGCTFKVLSLVCADDTPLAEKSNFTLSMPWAFDNSVCQTRCVTNFYFAAVYIISKLTGNQTVLNDLEHIVNNGPEFIKTAESLSEELSVHPWTHCVVLADAELEGLAEEAALAFKEICQLPSNYYHLMDLRHGPMVLLGEKTLVLAVLGSKNDLELKLIQDIKNKNSEIITFSDLPMEQLSISYGHSLSYISCGIPFIILCQMIAYKKSLQTGADPDKPSGLEAWIKL